MQRKESVGFGWISSKRLRGKGSCFLLRLQLSLQLLTLRVSIHRLLRLRLALRQRQLPQLLGLLHLGQLLGLRQLLGPRRSRLPGHVHGQVPVQLAVHPAEVRVARHKDEDGSAALRDRRKERHRELLDVPPDARLGLLSLRVHFGEDVPHARVCHHADLHGQLTVRGGLSLHQLVQVVDLDWEAPAAHDKGLKEGAAGRGKLPEVLPEEAGLDGRRHEDEPGARVDPHEKPDQQDQELELGLPLMRLIQNDVRDIRKGLRLHCQPGQEVARRREGQALARQDLAADAVADLVSNLLAPLLCHPPRQRHRGHAPRLRDQDVGGHAQISSLVEDVLRHLGGLPAAGAAHDHHYALLHHHLLDLVVVVVDGQPQARALPVGHRSWLLLNLRSRLLLRSRTRSLPFSSCLLRSWLLLPRLGSQELGLRLESCQLLSCCL
mmetsp:Transcript_113107/g.330614  ORF Transcript_113107/g.330614 Transcript_113107/m.330614 type:complete len:436 (+) Transcript_113107:486-1793(+)